MGDAFGDGTYYVEKEGKSYALSDTHFIHTLNMKKEEWEMDKL